jgi:hypothetical protein
MSNIVPAEQAPRLPSIVAGNRPQPIVPTDFEGAWRIARAVVSAGMAPNSLETAEKAMVAVLHGLEVGMTPMMALQSIAVINGRPSIWGDGAMGLVRASGICEYVTEELRGEGDARCAVCTVKRRGEPQPQSRSFSVADAKLAKLWGKAGPWTQYPERMLQLRARAFALRDVFADVLRGLHIAEEAQDTPPPAAAALVPPPPPPPEPARVPPVPTTPDARKAIASHPDAPKEVADRLRNIDEPAEPGGPDADWFQDLEVELAAAPDAESIEQVWADRDVRGVCADEGDWQIACGIRRRIEPGWTPED